MARCYAPPVLRTSDKKCKKQWPLELKRFGGFSDLAVSFC